MFIEYINAIFLSIYYLLDSKVITERKWYSTNPMVIEDAVLKQELHFRKYIKIENKVQKAQCHYRSRMEVCPYRLLASSTRMLRPMVPRNPI